MVDLKKWFKKKGLSRNGDCSPVSGGEKTDVIDRTPLPKSIMAVLFFLFVSSKKIFLIINFKVLNVAQQKVIG